MANQEENTEENKRSLPRGRRLFIIIIVVLAIVIIIPAGWFWGRKYLVKQNKSLNQAQNTEVSNTNPAATNFSVILANVVKDSDSDGLSDEEEKKLGTDSNNKDTDLDGLSDFDEVKKYMTDPAKKDTDADGFSDGDEVQRGFNPKGEGKLLDVNRILTNQPQ
jgi:hypothetical protein